MSSIGVHGARECVRRSRAPALDGPVSTMTDWLYHTHGVEGDPATTVAGVPVWAGPWRLIPGAHAAVRDPLYGQPYTFPVYELESPAGRVRFAAGEFSAGVLGFYTPADSSEPGSRAT